MKRLTNEIFIARSEKIFPGRFGYDRLNYNGAGEKVEIFCNIHQEYFEQIANNHLNGLMGCKKCQKIDQNRNLASDAEEFARRSQEVHGPDHYNYDDVVYVNARTKVKIFCNIHQKYFEQTPDSHLGGHGCKLCAAEKMHDLLAMTQEEFLEKVKDINGDFYDYSEAHYINWTTPIKVICPIHGLFTQSAGAHMVGKGCELCGKQSSKEKQSFSEETFLKLANEKHGTHFDYSEIDYIDYHTKIKIYCNIHKIYFEQTPTKHLRGNGGCLKCQTDKLIEDRTLTTEEFIEISNKKHDFKYDYSESHYLKGYLEVIIICPKHGPFPQIAQAHMGGKGCSKCVNQISKPEFQWLNSLNLPDDKEHRQVSLRINGKLYKVDGLDPHTKTIYEFYGDFFHGNPNNSKFKPEAYNKITHCTFGELYTKTLAKESALKAAGYTVISIWESDYKAQKKLEKLAA